MLQENGGLLRKLYWLSVNGRIGFGSVAGKDKGDCWNFPANGESVQTIAQDEAAAV
jgi:hypothetical protein